MRRAVAFGEVVGTGPEFVDDGACGTAAGDAGDTRGSDEGGATGGDAFTIGDLTVGGSLKSGGVVRICHIARRVMATEPA